MLNNKIVTDCCNRLIDIDCAINCELTNSILCEEHVAYIDANLFDNGKLKIFDKNEINKIDSKEFILTSKNIVKWIKRIMSAKTDFDLDKVTNEAIESYYKENDQMHHL